MDSVVAAFATLSLGVIVKPILLLLVCLIAVKLLLKITDKILLKSKF